MNEFKRVKLDDISFDANKMFDKEWAVLTASKKDESSNCLTFLGDLMANFGESQL